MKVGRSLTLYCGIVTIQRKESS